MTGSIFKGTEWNVSPLQPLGHHISDRRVFVWMLSVTPAMARWDTLAQCRPYVLLPHHSEVSISILFSSLSNPSLEGPT